MGPLEGLKVVEMAGIGPAPMCAMLLADLGAQVIRLERPVQEHLGIPMPLKYNVLLRGRPAISVDLKRQSGLDFALDLISRADVLLEGFRPGTMERLGLGPDQCLAANPRLVYGRMTGWGQGGTFASMAGHDLNYIALSGALHAIGRHGQPPTPPLNLVGDFGGGALYLAFGVLAAVMSARGSGRGQVVDAAMVDGAASLMTAIYGLQGAGLHGDERGTNTLDSGAPFYDVYACADGEYLAVAPLEPKFRAILFDKLGLDCSAATGDDQAEWPALRKAISERISSKTRDEWAREFAGTDACVSPVLSMREAPGHPHNVARQTFVEVDGVIQPAPAPRFSETPCGRPLPPAPVDAEVAAVLGTWGYSEDEIDRYRSDGAIVGPEGDCTSTSRRPGD